YDSLAPGGWLIVSPAEASSPLLSMFESVSFPGAILYRKGSGKTKAVCKKKASVMGPVRVLCDDIPEKQRKAATDRALVNSRVDALRRPNPHDHLPKAQKLKAALPTRRICAEARSLYEQKDFQRAEEQLLCLLSHHADDPEALALLARVYADQRRLPEAGACCEKAVALDRMNPELHYLLAVILAEQNRFPETTVSLRRALYLNNDFILAHYTLGDVACRQGDRRGAEKHFRNCLLLLEQRSREEVIPLSGGMTAGALGRMIETMIGSPEKKDAAI
ncbi:MAG: tetratricopeptide repeat protein, partial [Syntrophales bacterium]|nr:tetratricopeptide repeat protein [Syntrophales bacterium]